MAFLIILSIILLVVAWTKHREARYDKIYDELWKAMGNDKATVIYFNDVVIPEDNSEETAKEKPLHSMEDDFQHFLSYSGFSELSVDAIDKLRAAFEAGGK
jgi:hypothetical protein